MKKVDWRWVSFFVIVIGFIFLAIPIAYPNYGFLANIGAVMTIGGVPLLFVSFALNDIKRDNDKLRQIGADHLPKKIRNSVGTVYLLIIVLLYFFVYLFKDNDIICIVLEIVIPVVAAIILCETNLKNDKKYVTADNYSAIKKNVIFIMILVAIFGSGFNIINIISYAIATIIILNHLKPKKTNNVVNNTNQENNIPSNSFNELFDEENK